jgi:hypothetical protein
MSILVNTHSEQEEKVLLAFLDSLKFEYKTAVSDTKEGLQEEFLSSYNHDIKEGEADIEQGNFSSQEDVEKFFSERRKTLK